MKTTNFIAIIFLLFNDSVFAQLECTFNIEIEEIAMNEDLIFVEEEFEDGEWKNIRNRIIHYKQKNNLLELQIGITSLHKSYSKCNAKLKNGQLFVELIPTKRIDEVESNYTMYREIILKIKGIDKIPKQVFFKRKEIFLSKEKFKTYPERFEIVNNDTINRYDKYGQRQGKWINEFRNEVTEKNYVDSKLVKAEKRIYFENGNIKTQYFIDNINSSNKLYFRSFFETGEIKEENYQIYNSPGKFKIKWYTNKNIFQENYYDGKQILITQYKENGELDCKCSTELGTNYFKGWITSHTTNEYKVPCTYFDKEGNEVKQEEKIFKLFYEIRPR